VVGDKAIKSGNQIPDGYEEMAQVTYPQCDEEYMIVHQTPFKEQRRADKQSENLKNILAGGHVDSKHNEHIDSFADLEEE